MKFELCGRDPATGRVVEPQFAVAYGVMKARNAAAARTDMSRVEVAHSHQGGISFSHADKDSTSRTSSPGQSGDEELTARFFHAGMDTKSHMGSDLVPLEGCSQ